MDQGQLRRFAHFYEDRTGAHSILRRYLGLSEDYVLPVGISHGIDYGQSHSVQDVHCIEPIYWAYNKRLFEAAKPIKSAIEIAHPLLLAMAGQALPEPSCEALLIGPPPGPENDRRLLKLIGKDARASTTILVKPLPGYRQSIEFWENEGFHAITSAGRTGPLYAKLLDLLARYNEVRCCTFSSAAILAAAMGKKVTLLRGYFFGAYEGVGAIGKLSPRSQLSVDVVRTFASGTPKEVSATAKNMLGAQLDMDPGSLWSSVEEHIERLPEPLHFEQKYPRPLRKLISEAALWMDRPGLIRPSFLDLVRGRLKHPRLGLQVYEVERDEIACWLEGFSQENFRLKRVPSVRGVTVPGTAVEPYGC